MKEHTKSYVSLLTLFIVLVIFVQTNVLTLMIFGLKGTTKQVTSITKEEEKEKIAEIQQWKLTIPKINVSANIEEGTEEEIINNNIGHFTNTSQTEGNIGLIAGCYGYNKNYFKELEKLQEGDVILYQYGDTKKQYKVILNIIIEQNDWSYLNDEEEDKLTLITGVIDQPEKRRCVQAQVIN